MTKKIVETGTIDETKKFCAACAWLSDNLTFYRETPLIKALLTETLRHMEKFHTMRQQETPWLDAEGLSNTPKNGS